MRGRHAVRGVPEVSACVVNCGWLVAEWSEISGREHSLVDGGRRKANIDAKNSSA
jgi:hypothetical protein